MLQKLLDKALPMNEATLDDPWTVQYWSYLLPHFLSGLVLGWIAWKMIGLLAS